ncbi:MAG: hypothetical protein U1F43_17890 [Myxococcota bacterium]
MTLRHHDLGTRLARLCALAGMTIIPACAGDGAGDTSDESTLAISGFALSADDESDDGFTDGADTTPLEEQVADDLAGDESELPPADEADAEAVPPESPDRIGRTVLFVWGQPELNPALADQPTQWKGRIWSDVAAVHALRAVRFERAAQHDHLVRDEDPKTASFDTTTTTLSDGLLVRISAPRTAAALDGEVSFETEHFTKTIALRDLLAGMQETFVADDLGNELQVVSALPNRCAHGLVRMHWERKNARGGVFGGRIYGADGSISGHLVGLWGTVDGKHRMKGVFRAEDGTFKGTIRGAWNPLPPTASGKRGGTFRGVWTLDGQVKGVIGGLFAVGDEGGAGTAGGFWRAACGDGLACGGDLALPAPPEPACACSPDAENDLDTACSCHGAPPDTCVAPEDPAAD